MVVPDPIIHDMRFMRLVGGFLLLIKALLP